MITLYISLAGILMFVLGALLLGLWLRRHPSKENAERSSRHMHFLFFTCLSLLPLSLFIYPGVTHLDALVGLPSLSPRLLFLVLGILLALPGLYLLAVTNQSLRKLASGANAFRLTKHIVDTDIYHMTRNPIGDTSRKPPFSFQNYQQKGHNKRRLILCSTYPTHPITVSCYPACSSRRWYTATNRC